MEIIEAKLIKFHSILHIELLLALSKSVVRVDLLLALSKSVDRVDLLLALSKSMVFSCEVVLLVCNVVTDKSVLVLLSALYYNTHFSLI